MDQSSTLLCKFQCSTFQELVGGTTTRSSFFLRCSITLESLVLRHNDIMSGPAGEARIGGLDMFLAKFLATSRDVSKDLAKGVLPIYLHYYIYIIGFEGFGDGVSPQF